jgi:hypothetical protein
MFARGKLAMERPLKHRGGEDQSLIIRWIHQMIMARGAHELPIMATDPVSVAREGGPSQVKADPLSMTTYDATGLARIYRYASRARMWTILLLGFSTALCGFAFISLQLWSLPQAALLQTVLLFIVFLIAWATFTVASRDFAPTPAWLYSATVLYSAPIPILLLTGTSAFGGSAEILTSSEILTSNLLCLPLGIGAWRAWKAAQLLERDPRMPAFVMERECRLRRADQMQADLEKAAARKLQSDLHRRIRSGLYLKISQFAGAVFVFLVAGIYCLQLLRYSQVLSAFEPPPRMVGKMAVDAFAPSAMVLIVCACCLPFLVLAILLRGRAHRWQALRAREVRALDSRAPILLLRSFADDGLRLGRSRLRSTLAWVAPGTFEHFLSRALLPLGPLIAIGEPNEKLPPLGFNREYYGELEWKEAVRGLMCEARLVVVVVHQTPNLIWEIGTLAAEGMLEKTVLLLPPVDRRSLTKRWLGLVSELPIDELRASLWTVVRHRTRLARFNVGGHIVAYDAQGSDSWAYDACLTIALQTEEPVAGKVGITKSRPPLYRRTARRAALTSAAIFIGALLLSKSSPVPQDLQKQWEVSLNRVPYLRALMRDNASIKERLYIENMRYALGIFGQLGELTDLDEDHLSKRYATILAPALAGARRASVSAHDQLLQNLAGHEATALHTAAGANATACQAYLLTGNPSELFKTVPKAAEMLLGSMEAAYLDGLQRGPVKVPSKAETQPIWVHAVNEPDALTSDEVGAMTNPDSAPASTLCRAYAKFLRNVSVRKTSEAATVMRYLMADEKS